MKHKQIQKKDLIIGKHYVGRGRTGNIGLWTGDLFLVIAEKLGEYVIKKETYYTENSGSFQPFLLIDEGENINPIGNRPWDKHYSKCIEFKFDEH
jgi:hypothetical protein